jgi:branched-chain amino acid transport system permease protein
VSRAGVLRAAVFFGLLLLLPFGIGPQWILNLFIFTLMYAGLASSWNLVGGYAGYPSLGHAAFFGIGAYAVAIVFEGSVGDGYSPFLFLPVIGVGAALLSIPIGWIAMRTRADVFAIVTITLLFIVQTLAFNLRSLTGGAQGKGVAVPPFPIDTYSWPFYYAMLTLLALAMGISMYFRRSKVGLSLSAVRADEDKAHGVGVRVTGVKLIAFAASVGITAMIGGVWAYYIGFIYPQFAVDPLITIGMVLMTFLGGRATLWGPVIGAFILVPAQQFFAYQFGANQFYLLAYAAIFLVIMLVLPRGILPTITDRLRNRRKKQESVPDVQPKAHVEMSAEAGKQSVPMIEEVQGTGR